MKEIALQNGMKAIVDDEDFDRLSQFNWRAYQPTAANGFIAKATIEKRQVAMHTYLMNPPEGFEVDHKNHNTLDNQKSNLRIATHSQNQCNRRSKMPYGYRGVSLLNRKTPRYRAAISFEKRHYHIGIFDCPKEAAKAYDAKAIKLHGEFATLNFPQELR